MKRDAARGDIDQPVRQTAGVITTDIMDTFGLTGRVFVLAVSLTSHSGRNSI
jgi:hypothetical protein